MMASEMLTHNRRQNAKTRPPTRQPGTTKMLPKRIEKPQKRMNRASTRMRPRTHR